jgi:hypothetical protein
MLWLLKRMWRAVLMSEGKERTDESGFCVILANTLDRMELHAYLLPRPQLRKDDVRICRLGRRGGWDCGLFASGFPFQMTRVFSRGFLSL